jgi:Flp pilus assembly protein TadB
MKIFDAISFQSLFLIIAGVSIFALLVLLSSGKKKTYRAAMMLNQKELDLKKKNLKDNKFYITMNGFDRFLASTKILTKYSPYNIITEAHKIEWMIGYKEYITYFVAGGAIATGLVWVAIGKSFFAIYAMALGLFAPRILLYFQQKKFEITQQERIVIFMKTVANAMNVFGNAIDAIEEVMPLVHEKIRVDLTKAVALLKSGKSLSYSFKDMLEKYDYPELHFFIDMLEVAHEHGGEYNHVLNNIALDFEQQKVLQVKLDRAMAQAKRAFYQNATFVALLPIIFMVATEGRMYKILVSTIFGKAALLGNLIVIGFFWYRLEKIAKFDPRAVK